MRGVVRIKDIRTNKFIEPIYIDTSLTGQLEKMSSQCDEKEANYCYESYSIHHANVESLMKRYYTKEFHKIDRFYNPFSK
jgi:hypothetical protein